MKQLRKLLWLTQLGISLVTPPLLCIFLAHLAQSKWGWGGWIMAVATQLPYTGHVTDHAQIT